MIGLGLHLPLLPRVVRRLKRPWRHYHRRRRLAQQTLVAHRMAHALAAEGRLPGLSRAALASVMVTRSDVVVALLAATPGAPPRLALKLPLTTAALESLERHRAVLAELNAHPALETIRPYLPQVVDWQPQAATPYLLETALPGQPAEVWLTQPARLEQVIADAAGVIGEIHLATARWQTIDEAAWMALAGRDLEWLRTLAAGWPRAQRLQASLERLQTRLAPRFIGQRLPLARVHGDLWLGNLLTGADGRLSGMLDWDRSAPDDLPLLDLWHVLAYTRKLVRRSEPGQELLDYLLPARFSPAERRLIRAALARLDMPDDPAWLESISWLYWVRFAAANLRRYPAFRSDAIWLDKNVFLVLRRGVR